jgi:hypothetical protein
MAVSVTHAFIGIPKKRPFFGTTYVNGITDQIALTTLMPNDGTLNCLRAEVVLTEVRIGKVPNCFGGALISALRRALPTRATHTPITASVIFT